MKHGIIEAVKTEGSLPKGTGRRQIMNQPTRPTKEQVRDYMALRRQQHTPPPPLKEIRRQLGWDLVETPRDKPLR